LRGHAQTIGSGTKNREQSRRRYWPDTTLCQVATRSSKTIWVSAR
jgi:hypothetical protein